MKIREAEARDQAEWLRMRIALWTGSRDDHDGDIRRDFQQSHGQTCVFVAEDAGRLVGFIELDQRKYAPGCQSSPVPFIEGCAADAPSDIGGVAVPDCEPAAKAAK